MDVVNEVKAVKNNFLFHFSYPNEQRTRRYNQCHYPGQEYEQVRVQNHVSPPYPLAGKTLIQDDLQDLPPTHVGIGGQDRAMETQHWCDHLPEDKGQVQPLDQEPHLCLKPWS